MTVSTMDRQRIIQIIDKCKDWQNTFPDMGIKDCFFALYDGKDITAKELGYLIDWMTL